MPSDHFSGEVSVVGGVYRETCYWPSRDAIFGSAWRAVRVFRSFAPEAVIKLETAGNACTEKLLKAYGSSESLSYRIEAHPSMLVFFYRHPLAKPAIHGFSGKKLQLKAMGQYIIGFGMMEATTYMDGEYVVYDPQSPVNPVGYRDQGGNGRRGKYLCLAKDHR